MIELNLWAAWIGIALGLASGTIQGLFFAREDWLGGYGSWPRRMLRLGHISFFGIAFLKALSHPPLGAFSASGIVSEPRRRLIE